MNKCFKYSWKFLFYLFLFCIFGSAQPQGIGEPSVYHAVVVIFLEFFAWGLLTTPMLAVSLLFFCQRSAWRLCSPDRTQLLQRRVSVFSHVYPGSNEPVGPQTLCLSPRGLFENLISRGGGTVQRRVNQCGVSRPFTDGGVKHPIIACLPLWSTTQTFLWTNL